MSVHASCTFISSRVHHHFDTTPHHIYRRVDGMPLRATRTSQLPRMRVPGPRLSPPVLWWSTWEKNSTLTTTGMPSRPEVAIGVASSQFYEHEYALRTPLQPALRAHCTPLGTGGNRKVARGYGPGRRSSPRGDYSGTVGAVQYCCCARCSLTLFSLF